MTSEEISAHHARMRSAKTAAERDAYRAEHHKGMMARAQERGVALDPAGCPRAGMGMGQGMGQGQGQGMGHGQGMGRGMGRGQGPGAPPEPAPPAEK